MGTSGGVCFATMTRCAAQRARLGPVPHFIAPPCGGAIPASLPPTPGLPGVVEEQLAGVQPILDAARAAVGGIKSDHLSEVRSLRMAPDAIRWGGGASKCVRVQPMWWRQA